MARVVHFELAADDPERAGKFYREVFGWESHKWEGPEDYWMLATGEGPGIDGAIMRRNEHLPNIVNTVDVTSLDAALEKVEGAGGKVVMPKMAVPGIGWLAYCQDTEGNTFGMMQSDEKAA